MWQKNGTPRKFLAEFWGKNAMKVETNYYLVQAGEKA